ncbi:M48 family metallopeptidase [Sphingobium boeckii]|uniref:M48 family metallopeptidase n=1 Tax=Sphingobium boeckii TaxID=1082345 RepID=UPI001FE6148C|nr:SprT family zinc-dependent metalloprotease [Sphingobium boeckii]
MSTDRSDLIFGAGGQERPLQIRRNPQARRMRLSVDPRDGAVILSLPQRASLRPALDWAEAHRGWIDAALAKLPEERPILPGGSVPFEGEPLLIDWQPALTRTVRHEPGRLVFGGPSESISSRVQTWLKRQARETLERETREIAVSAGVSVARVSIADPRARWGSCSADGDIRYSWRLIMAPAFVRRSTVAHEVAHRVHMDHSPAFHALARKLLGSDPAIARAWLRREGSALHWVGRGS